MLPGPKSPKTTFLALMAPKLVVPHCLKLVWVGEGGGVPEGGGV